MSKEARIYLQYFYAIRSWSFQNICNQIGWPVFAPPCRRHSKTHAVLLLSVNIGVIVIVWKNALTDPVTLTFESTNHTISRIPCPSCSHSVPLFTKQYKLVPAIRRWGSMAGKVTVGLASHWPCVTDSVVYQSPTGWMTWDWEMSSPPKLRSEYNISLPLPYNKFVLSIVNHLWNVRMISCTEAASRASINKTCNNGMWKSPTRQLVQHTTICLWRLSDKLFVMQTDSFHENVGYAMHTVLEHSLGWHYECDHWLRLY